MTNPALLHSSSSESLIFIVHSIMDIRKKYKRCNALVINLTNINTTLNETNQKDLASLIDEHRADIEDKLAEEQNLRVDVEEKIETIRKEHNVQIDEHAAQIDAQKRKCKRYMLSKLNMISVHYKRKLDEMTEKLINMLIKFNEIEKDFNNKIQGRGHLCKNYVGAPTHIPSDTSSPESLNDVELSDYDRTTINLLLRIRGSPTTLPKNLDLADTILNEAKGLFKQGQVKVCLSDPASGHYINTDNSAILSSWPRSGNNHVVSSADLLFPVENMSIILTLRARHRKYGDGDTCMWCTTLARFGVLSIAMTSTKDSSSPIIPDLLPGHNQIVKFDGSSGSTSIDVNKVFARKLIGEALANQRAVWVEGKDGEVALSKIINKKNLIVEFVSDEDISHLVDSNSNLRSFHGREDDHKAMVVHDDGGNKCLVFTCMQIASTIASPANVHCVGNFANGFLHDGFVHFSSLQEHQDTRSFLPLHPRKNRYYIYFLQKMDLKKSLRCFMKMTYFRTQSTI